MAKFKKGDRVYLIRDHNGRDPVVSVQCKIVLSWGPKKIRLQREGDPSYLVTDLDAAYVNSDDPSRFIRLKVISASVYNLAEAGALAMVIAEQLAEKNGGGIPQVIQK